MDKAAKWLKDSLAYEFHNAELLQKALTHRSAEGQNNERLEFLGDSVLQLVISERLFRERRGVSEGRLSRLRSSLVKDATLAEIAIELGIGEFLILGAGERKSGGHRRASILADAIEAMFGAIYLDAGFEAAREVIEKVYAERMDALPVGAELRDPKTRLQEWLQARQLALPRYEVDKVSGKAHKQFFDVSCSIDEPALVTHGNGTTRRDAEQQAADRMLAEIGADND